MNTNTVFAGRRFPLLRLDARFVLGLVVGIIAGIFLVSNRSGQFEPARAATYTDGSARLLLWNLRNMYAPWVLEYRGGVKRMWMGGWLTDADRANYSRMIQSGVAPSATVGPDKIFYSDFIDGAWTHPVLSFDKVGFHVNDPTVIQPPSSDGIDRSYWLYMYYTAIRNDDIEHGDWNRHTIGFASSLDGGRTWTDHGIIITQHNGVDTGGAWSPSALVVDNEIWLYYHGNRMPDPAESLQNYRSRFNLNGWQLIETDRLIFHHREPCVWGGTSLAYLCPPTYNADGLVKVNLDVSMRDGAFVLLANDPTSHFILRFVSTDGLNWQRSPHDTNPILNAGPYFVTTPHAEAGAGDRYSIYFGFSGADNSRFDSIHSWEFH